MNTVNRRAEATKHSEPQLVNPAALLQRVPRHRPIKGVYYAPNVDGKITISNMTAHDFANGWQGKLSLSSEGSQRPRTPTFPSSNRNGIVIFSGGSAANSLVEVFDQLREANHSTLSYVIPISDNGGSSSELIRVFGGPGNSLAVSSTICRRSEMLILHLLR